MAKNKNKKADAAKTIKADTVVAPDANKVDENQNTSLSQSAELDAKPNNKDGQGSTAESLDTEAKSEATGAQGSESENQLASGDQSQAEEELSEPDKKKIDKVAKDLFANRPFDVLYFTSDAVPFATENDAKQHAMSLGNKAVVKRTKNN